VSNRLVNLCKRITHCGGRKMRASEKAVLLTLADDARDHRQGRSSLTTRDICTITGLSPRAVGLAYVVLVEGELITREPGEPGAAIVSLVHPKEAPTETKSISAPASQSARGVAHIATPGGNNCQGSIEYKDITIDQYTNAGARAVDLEDGGFEPGPVDQVFDGWDRMAAAAQLPGPVGRDAARTVAVETLLASHGLWRVLAAVRKVGESDFLRGRRRAPGQGDWRADFDWVFEVRRYRASGNFQRLLEGSFTPDAVPMQPKDRAQRGRQQAIEGDAATAAPAEGRLAGETAQRARMRDALGEAFCRAFTDSATLTPLGQGWALLVPGAFAADHLSANHGAALQRAGVVSIEVAAKERALGEAAI